MDQDNYEYAAPNASALIQSLRAFGYDISTAIADLIDNSITAQAKRIDVLFNWNNNEPWIAIIDDGSGMTENELLEAMRPGSKSPLDIRSEDDLGRFGLGLKTASFSQCKTLTVASKKEAVTVRKWDLDLVTETNEWRLLKDGSPIIEELISKYLNEQTSGTIVLWEKLDRLIPEGQVFSDSYIQAFSDYGQRVKNHISRTFLDFMRGTHKVSFYMNNRLIAPWDPFFSSSNLTTLLPSEELFIDGQTIKIHPYILPHPNKLTPQELNELGDDRGWHDLQGFYVFRNRRLIIAGEWLLPRLEKKDIYRLARIRIDINSENDSGWNIDIKKSTAMPPVSVQDDLRRIAKLCRDRSSLIFQHRGKIIGRTASDEDFIWHQYVKNGKLGYAINRNHPLIRRLIDQDKTKSAETLLKFIEETIPVPAIITSHAENPDQMRAPYEGEDGSNYSHKLEAAYRLFTNELNLSPEDAVERLAHTEPFLYWKAALGSLCAKLRISTPSKS